MCVKVVCLVEIMTTVCLSAAWNFAFDQDLVAPIRGCQVGMVFGMLLLLTACSLYTLLLPGGFNELFVHLQQWPDESECIRL